jgi:branched-chain amino acid transport system permease protein
LGANRVIFLVLTAAGTVLLALMGVAVNEYILSIVNFVGIYAILAISLNITNGLTGLFSLGHPGFMAIGAMSRRF